MNPNPQNLGAHAQARPPGVGNYIKIGLSKFYRRLRSKIGPLVLTITFLLGILPVPFPHFGPGSISSTFLFPSPESKLLKQPFYQGLSSINSKFCQVLQLTSDMPLSYILINEDLAELGRHISQSPEDAYQTPSDIILKDIRQLENHTAQIQQDLKDFGKSVMGAVDKSLELNKATSNDLLRCSRIFGEREKPAVPQASGMSQELGPVCQASPDANALK